MGDNNLISFNMAKKVEELGEFLKQVWYLYDNRFSIDVDEESCIWFSVKSIEYGVYVSDSWVDTDIFGLVEFGYIEGNREDGMEDYVDKRVSLVYYKVREFLKKKKEEEMLKVKRVSNLIAECYSRIEYKNHFKSKK